MTMTRPSLQRHLKLIGGAALLLPLLGCVTVESPDKPIEINLNVDIRQEVLVRGTLRRMRYRVEGPFVRDGLPDVPLFLIVVGGGQRPLHP